MDDTKKIKMARDEVNTFPNRNLYKTQVECAINDRLPNPSKRLSIMGKHHKYPYEELPY